MILILEDNDDRVQRFLAVAQMVAPDLPVRIWRSAPEMVQDLVDLLEHASVISLDNDLNRFPGDGEDPGSGYEIAKLLSELIPCCPVIIHTSNAERRTWIQGELDRAGWTYEHVYPFGDGWIEQDWSAALRRVLGRLGHA